jgi:HD-like signal output (HDOD) protein/CheY-like chemotaxis protein
MEFVLGGQEALCALEAGPFDVIISDMRMPKMDGATLLRIVQERYPATVRIVLSGQAELETALRAVPVAHQFLNKPSEPGVIENVVERACRLQQIVNNDGVRAIVGRIRKLPTVPRVYSQLERALATDDPSMRDIAEIVKQDTAICAKILQVANSGFFGLPRAMVTVEDAARYLGLSTIRHVTLAVEVFTHGEERARLPQGISMEVLQRHSSIVGDVAASFFSERKQKEDAFVVGLLHDIGKLLMAFELPEKTEEVTARMRTQGLSMAEVENACWGVTHAEVGGYLLGLWGLPYSVVEAVANHHAPGRVEPREFGVLAAIHIADCLVGEVEDDIELGQESSGLDQDYIDDIGVRQTMAEWRRVAKDRVLRSRIEGA